jgi:hypothetical protein
MKTRASVLDEVSGAMVIVSPFEIVVVYIT